MHRFDMLHKYAKSKQEDIFHFIQSTEKSSWKTLNINDHPTCYSRNEKSTPLLQIFI